jgi:hypothetical protein
MLAFMSDGLTKMSATPARTKKKNCFCSCGDPHLMNWSLRRFTKKGIDRRKFVCIDQTTDLLWYFFVALYNWTANLLYNATSASKLFFLNDVLKSTKEKHLLLGIQVFSSCTTVASCSNNWDFVGVANGSVLRRLDMLKRVTRGFDLIKEKGAPFLDWLMADLYTFAGYLLQRWFQSISARGALGCLHVLIFYVIIRIGGNTGSRRCITPLHHDK